MRHTPCVASRTFVKFTFIRVQPEWRRREPAERAQDKREFAAACRDFAEDHLLRTYSLVGTRGDCDLMVRTVAPSLDPIHEFHVLLNQSGLMRWAEISHSYLAMTKESVYSEEPTPLEPRPGSDAKYLIVYPMWKKREWYLLARRGAVADHAAATSRPAAGTPASRSTPPTRTGSTTRSSWSRSTPTSRASSWTWCRSCAAPSRAPTPSPRRPIFTCISASPERALDALDGERPAPPRWAGVAPAAWPDRYAASSLARSASAS